MRVGRRGRAAAALGVAALPYAVSGVLVIARRGWAHTPAGDLALTELAVRHTSRLGQLLGPYSRYGWHHPGPLLYYVLAPFYVVLGANQAGLYLGAIVVNCACAVGIVALVGRRAGAMCALAVAALLDADVLIAGAHFAAYPWNPVVIVLPLALTVVAGGVAIAGSPWAVVIMCGAASFVVQSDVGPGLAVAAVVAVAVIVLLVRRRREAGKPLVASVLLLVAIWLPPGVEQLIHSPGNLGLLAHFFSSGGRRQGARAAVALFTYGLSIVPLGHDADFNALHQQPSAIRVLVCASFLAVLVLSAIVGLRGTATVGGWICLFASIAAVASFPAMFAVRDEPIGYLVYWLAAIGVAGWTGIIAVALGRARLARPPTHAAVAVIAVVAAVATLTATVRGSSRAPWIFDDGGGNALVATRTTAYLGAHHLTHPELEFDQDTWPSAAALADDLDRAGYAFSVERRWVFMFDPGRAESGRSDVTLRVVSAARAGAGRVVARAPGVVVMATERVPR